MKKYTVKTQITEYSYDELSEEYKKLIELAKENSRNAYAPYSQFNVGAVVLLENGVTVNGNNQENSAYPSSLCAERVAMYAANANYPNISPKAIAIAANTKGEFLKSPITPCGSCRQVLLESEVRYNKPIEVILYGSEHIYIISNVKDLLPLCFEKESLNLTDS